MNATFVADRLSDCDMLDIVLVPVPMAVLCLLSKAFPVLPPWAGIGVALLTGMAIAWWLGARTGGMCETQWEAKRDE